MKFPYPGSRKQATRFPCLHWLVRHAEPHSIFTSSYCLRIARRWRLVPGFIGFAMGRTSFWDPLVNWRAKKITQEDAVNEIVRRYREFVAIFEEKVRAA